MKPWYISEGQESDVVVSTRVRLARNFDDFPFVTKMTKNDAEFIVNKCREALIDTNSTLSKNLKLYKMDELSPLDKQIMVEKHLISPNMIAYGSGSAVILSDDESISIMINEEDHIRIQCLGAGFKIDEIWKLANKIDDLIEENIKFAFDEKYGYLTCCPTNVGTGLRASVMLHLPMLNLSGKLTNIINAVTKLGMAVRGLYGEGTEATGNFYQVSNQVTLAMSEQETLEKLKGIVNQIIKEERLVRQNILDKNKIKLEDRVCRSFGIIKNAKIISTDEFMKLVSDVRLGVNLGIIKDVSLEKLNELLIMVQPANINKSFGENLGAEERDIKRAEVIKNILQ